MILINDIKEKLRFERISCRANTSYTNYNVIDERRYKKATSSFISAMIGTRSILTYV